MDFETGRRLWHYNTTKVERKRYFLFAPLVAGAGAIGTAALGGAGLFGMFGKKKKSQSQDDPLAGIRMQLQSLAAGVPAMVAKQKELIGQRYGEAKSEGIQNIGEDVYANRGMGRTSIYDRLRQELATKLAQGQSADELAADEWGIGRQAAILGQAGGFAAQEQPEQPSVLSQILGQGAGLAANLFGQNWLNEQSMDKLRGFFPQTTTARGGGVDNIPSLQDMIKQRAGSMYCGGTY